MSTEAYWLNLKLFGEGQSIPVIWDFTFNFEVKDISNF